MAQVLPNEDLSALILYDASNWNVFFSLVGPMTTRRSFFSLSLTRGKYARNAGSVRYWLSAQMEIDATSKVLSQ